MRAQLEAESFIKSIDDAQNTGGGILCDFITLKNGLIIQISEDGLSIYKNEEEQETGKTLFWYDENDDKCWCTNLKAPLQKMLDLSNCHVTHNTATMLESHDRMVDFATGESKIIPARWRTHEYGFTFWPTEPDVEKGWSNAPELEAINKYAYEHGCILVNFDQDAEEVVLFEKFEW